MKGIQIDAFNSLELKGVSFSYEASAPIFEDFSLKLPTGSNVFVSGPSGQGQSTLLKLMAVLIQPKSGQYLINGLDTTQMSFEEFLPIRRKIGYTFDYGGLFANRTLLDNMKLPLHYHNVCSPEEADRVAKGFAEQFGFTRQMYQRPAMVSGGLRKLVTVLRAFVLKPELMIMDDPFTGLGVEWSRHLVRLVKDRRQEGELKHLFLTSRDEVWPHWLGCETMTLQNGIIGFENRGAA